MHPNQLAGLEQPLERLGQVAQLEVQARSERKLANTSALFTCGRKIFDSAKAPVFVLLLASQKPHFPCSPGEAYRED